MDTRRPPPDPPPEPPASGDRADAAHVMEREWAANHAVFVDDGFVLA